MHLPLAWNSSTCSKGQEMITVIVWSHSHNIQSITTSLRPSLQSSYWNWQHTILSTSCSWEGSRAQWCHGCHTEPVELRKFTLLDATAQISAGGSPLKSAQEVVIQYFEWSVLPNEQSVCCKFGKWCQQMLFGYRMPQFIPTTAVRTAVSVSVSVCSVSV